MHIAVKCRRESFESRRHQQHAADDSRRESTSMPHAASPLATMIDNRPLISFALDSDDPLQRRLIARAAQLADWLTSPGRAGDNINNGSRWSRPPFPLPRRYGHRRQAPELSTLSLVHSRRLSFTTPGAA
jgi:hypothetical protein